MFCHKGDLPGCLAGQRKVRKHAWQMRNKFKYILDVDNFFDKFYRYKYIVAHRLFFKQIITRK